MSEASTIQRDPRDGEHPFAQISRSLIRDEKLSPECRWLLIYLLSMKDGWVVKVKQIWDHVKPHMGRAKVYKVIQEGIEKGYIKKELIKEGNLIKGLKYYISESPRYSNNFSDIPETKTPGTKLPESDTIKNSIDKKENKKEEVGAEAPNHSPPPSKPPKREKKDEEYKEVAPRVFLTTSQENALKKRSEAEIFNLHDVYTKLSDWKLSKQITGGSGDFKAIVGWVIKAYKEDRIAQLTSTKVKPNTEENKALAEKIGTQFPKLIANGSVYVGYDHIEFISGRSYENIKFVENGFRERCLNRLRKMQLPIDGL